MSLATLARTHPRLIDWGIRLDRVPAVAWLGLQALALTPSWLWMAARLRDGEDVDVDGRRPRVRVAPALRGAL